MTRIFSSMTRTYKKLFPLLWFGTLALFLLVALASGAATKDPMFLLIPVGMAVFGYFLMRMLVLDLVDEVLDGGDFLLIRNRGQEERVALSNIMNVSASTMTNPVRITLRLIVPSRLGSEIVFTPPIPSLFKSFTRSVVAEDLTLRVHEARSRQAR